MKRKSSADKVLKKTSYDLERSPVVPADSNSTYKSFLCSSVEKKTKTPREFQRYTAISAIKLHMPCVSYTAGSHVCLNYGSIEDHMLDFYRQEFYFTSLEMFSIH